MTIMKSILSETILFLGVLTIALLTGCGIPSVHPLYEPDDLVLNDRMTGTWQKGEGQDSFSVMRMTELKEKLMNEDLFLKKETDPVDDESSDMESEVTTADDLISYFNELIDKGLENMYIIQNKKEYDNFYLAGLINLNESYYLDLYKIDIGLDIFAYSVHIFMKISFDDNEVIMHMFSQDWLNERIKNRQVRIKHEVNDMDDFLLTASTAELQKFVIKYGDAKELFEHSESYYRINGEPEFHFAFEDED